MTISRECIGLAAEFAVASELCKRGIYAQLTFGNGDGWRWGRATLTI